MDKLVGLCTDLVFEQYVVDKNCKTMTRNLIQQALNNSESQQYIPFESRLEFFDHYYAMNCMVYSVICLVNHCISKLRLQKLWTSSCQGMSLIRTSLGSQESMDLYQSAIALSNQILCLWQLIHTPEYSNLYLDEIIENMENTSPSISFRDLGPIVLEYIK